EWRREVGQPVTRGEVVLIVESEKAVFDVEAEADGVLAQILVPAGEEGAVLQPVGYIAPAAVPARDGSAGRIVCLGVGASAAGAG
ncbi:MAG: lipoyl domain-containing protein, partial [Gemmatimonadota bacterium]